MKHNMDSGNGARHHSKRKRVNEAPCQRQVAQKLLHCADVSDSLNSLRHSLAIQYQRYLTQKARRNEMSSLCIALEQFTQFQTYFHAEMDNEDFSLVRDVDKRTNKLLTAITKPKMSIAVRTENIVRTLPDQLKAASKMAFERRQLIKEQQQLPSKHQWIPLILWRIYNNVVEDANNDKGLKPLKMTMHYVMKTLKETNPYYYMQVVYQTPPKHLRKQWKIRGSAKLKTIVASITPYFVALSRKSSALNHKDVSKRINDGWYELRVTMVLLKRAARHFHEIILYLYALAMGRDVSKVHAGIITEKAAKEMDSNDSGLRAQLKLDGDTAFSEDSLMKESYEWTPELLVYLDEWKYHRKSRRVPFGFHDEERWKDFLPYFAYKKQFRRRKTQVYVPRFDVLAEFGYKLRNLLRLWQNTQLSLPSFKSMSIEDIGFLEQEIKGSFGGTINLMYKIMLARWMARKRSTQWWASLNFRKGLNLQFESNKNDSFGFCLEGVTPGSEAKASTNVKSNDDVEEITNAKKCDDDVKSERIKERSAAGFRSPTRTKLRASCRKTSSLDDTSSSFLSTKESLEDKDLCNWSDDKKLAAMMRLRDRLTWSSISSESCFDSKLRCDVGNDWQVTHIANRACRIVDQVMRLAETRKSSSVLQKENNSVSDLDTSNHIASCSDSQDQTLKELHESVQSAYRNVSEMLNSYDGQHSSQWRDAILYTAQATLKLLRLIAQDDDMILSRTSDQ
ncbi:hypothetical protein Plhal304r1_c014g0051791 [Plasmopara halstedii]